MAAVKDGRTRSEGSVEGEQDAAHVRGGLMRFDKPRQPRSDFDGLGGDVRWAGGAEEVVEPPLKPIDGGDDLALVLGQLLGGAADHGRLAAGHFRQAPYARER